MRLRPTLLMMSLALPLFAACGDDGGSGGDDGGGDDGGGQDSGLPQDQYVPPAVNCAPLDLTGSPEIDIVNGAFTPNPQGGTVVAGTYELSSIKLNSQIPVMNGKAHARIEIVPGAATAGSARVAVTITGTAFGQPVNLDEAGAGLYTISGTDLTVADGCGGNGDPIPVLEYTATATTLMMWAEYSVSGIPVPIELGLVKE